MYAHLGTSYCSLALHVETENSSSYIYTTKREIEFQEIQKYQWNAQKIPDIMVKCFSSGGHFAASEAVK